MKRAPGPPSRYKDMTGTDPNRLAGISDGIFSVGMTLLVLGLAVPALKGLSTTENELWHALVSLAPSAAVYTMSFITLGIFWVGQGTQLGRLEKSDRYFTWMNIAFLFAVTMVPFSTLLLARFYWLQVALFVYWGNIFLLGITLFAAFEYGIRAHLFQKGDQMHVTRLVRGRIVIAQALYAIAVLLSFIFPTWVSITLIILIQLNYVLTPRIPILNRF